MKRLLCILMIFSILFLSSCKKEAYPQPTSAEKEFEQLIEFYGSKEGEYEDKEACTAVMDWPCPDFETCIYYINEIVTATYKTSWQVNDHYLHEFELDTDFKETGISKTFYVPEISVNIWDCNHSSRDILYEEGEKYLLLMTRTIGPYMVSEYFKIVHQRMAIKLTDGGKIDIEDSILCKHNFYESIKKDLVQVFF